MSKATWFVFGAFLISGCKGGLSLGNLTGKSGGSPPAKSESSGSSSPSGSSGGSKVAASDDDPREIASAIRELDSADKKLADGDIDGYARISTRFNYDWYVKNELPDHPKSGKLKARLASLDSKAVTLAGGLLAKHYGDGKRVLVVKNKDVIEAMDKAISLCSGATTTSGGYSKGETYQTRLADNMKKYEEALDRALRADPNVIRYVGEWTSGYKDVPMDLVRCEAKIAEHRLNIEDNYVHETAPEGAGEKKGCGKLTWLADGVQVGPNQFAPYTRSAGGQSYSEEIPCAKIPKKDSVGKELARAINEFKAYNKDIKNPVFVVRSKPYVQESNDDYRLHRWQEIEAYSKTMSLRANPCGGEKVFCEVGGSKGGRRFNELEHMLERADVHAGLRAERCKGHLKNAFKKWEEFRDFRDDLKKSGEWVEGATYKTKKGEKLPEPDFVAKFEKLGKLADERALGDYCSKRPAKSSSSPAAPNDDKKAKKTK
jgi:hypothetical protein